MLHLGQSYPNVTLRGFARVPVDSEITPCLPGTPPHPLSPHSPRTTTTGALYNTSIDFAANNGDKHRQNHHIWDRQYTEIVVYVSSTSRGLRKPSHYYKCHRLCRAQMTNCLQVVITASICQPVIAK